MRKLLLLALLLCAHAADAQVAQTGAGKATSAAAGCSQATAFLAQNGNYKPTETTALICGLVSQSASGGGSLYSHLFRFYIYESDTDPHSRIDVVSLATASTVNSGSLTFTANNGWAATAAAALDSSVTPSTTLSLNSTGLGGCVLTSRTSNSTASLWGSTDGTNFIYFRPINGSAALEGGVNDPSFATGTAPANVNGIWFQIRAGSTQWLAYHGTGGSASLLATVTATSSTLPNVSIYSLAYNQAGTPTSTDLVDQLGFFWISDGSYNATDVSNFAALIHTYSLAVQGSGTC